MPIGGNEIAVPALLDLWPTTGRILGLSRGSVFRAAQSGDLPIKLLGHRKMVVTARLEAMIGRAIVPADLGA